MLLSVLQDRSGLLGYLREQTTVLITTNIFVHLLYSRILLSALQVLSLSILTRNLLGRQYYFPQFLVENLVSKSLSNLTNVIELVNGSRII